MVVVVVVIINNISDEIAAKYHNYNYRYIVINNQDYKLAYLYFSYTDIYASISKEDNFNECRIIVVKVNGNSPYA